MAENTYLSYNGITLYDGLIKQYIDDKAETDATLTISDKAADAKETGDRLAILESQIADILYEAITIKSFTNSISSAENGSTVDTVTFNWSTNKTPSSLTLANEHISTSATSHVYTDLGLTKDSAIKSWELVATDDRGATAKKSTSISFLNGVYYGVSAEPETYDSAFILSLTKKLSSGKVSPIDVTSGAGQYIYYCVPVSMGTCSFNVGGFDGGFILIATVNFTNSKDYTTSYYIYRSDNSNLGTKTVTIK